MLALRGARRGNLGRGPLLTGEPAPAAATWLAAEEPLPARHSEERFPGRAAEGWPGGLAEGREGQPLLGAPLPAARPGGEGCKGGGCLISGQPQNPKGAQRPRMDRAMPRRSPMQKKLSFLEHLQAVLPTHHFITERVHMSHRLVSALLAACACSLQRRRPAALPHRQQAPSRGAANAGGVAGWALVAASPRPAVPGGPALPPSRPPALARHCCVARLRYSALWAPPHHTTAAQLPLRGRGGRCQVVALTS